MDLRPNTLSCTALLLLENYSHLCLYKGSLLYYIIHIIQYIDFQYVTLINKILTLLQYDFMNIVVAFHVNLVFLITWRYYSDLSMLGWLSSTGYFDG